MYCIDTQRQLDGYLDNSLQDSERTAISQHIQHCPACRQAFEQAMQMSLAMRAMPVAEPDAGYQQRVLSFLEEDRQTRLKPRRPAFPAWFVGGFATAMLALFAVWFIFVTPSTVTPTQTVAAITLHVIPQQTRKVDLVFNSPKHIQQATLRLELPDSVELEGYASRRVIEWKTDIVKGSNRLMLPLVAKSRSGGTLSASISHKGKTRTFKINIITDGTYSQHIPPDQMV